MAIYIPKIIDNLTSTSTVDGLSANQGRELKDQQGDLAELLTANKTDLVNAINEIKDAEAVIASLIDDINGEVI